VDPEEYLEQTLAQLNELRAKVPELQRQYEDAMNQTRSKDRRVSASVAPRGDLRSLTFHGESWRKMPPKELAELIVKTVNDAREQAVADAQAQLMQSLDPQLRSLLTGSDDLGAGWSVDRMVERVLGATGEMSAPVFAAGADDATKGSAA
jgi:DNA-binding protein YbaB